MPRLPGLTLIDRLLARLRSYSKGLRHRDAVEAEMHEEFLHHLELRTEDLMRQGLSRDEAVRRARVEFGNVDVLKDDARASRGLALFHRIETYWLDMKLGLRMVRKYPGLSVVAVIGMAVAIAIGAGAFGFISAFLDPTLPLPEGDRIVSIHNADVTEPGNPDRRSLHDFVAWRGELRSVADLSAFTGDSRNLMIPGAGVELASVALMTASGFRVARTPPVLGRPLLEEDEREGAPPVLVIAYEEWLRRFDGDPEVIGRLVQLGSQVHTVVGVMPEGFRFPINHRYWVPLQLDPDDYERGGGPWLTMFGRLTDGATMDDAQAELATIGLRSATLYPETHEHLRPRVLPYAHDYVDIDSPAIAWALRAFQIAVGLVLVLVAVNVAVLVYARTATRAGEIAVRTALGASRRRVVFQLFVEALVLSGAAAAIGLLIAGAVLSTAQSFLETSGAQLPFWMELELSTGTVLYVAGLAIVAGVIVGVLPGLKATGRRVHASLQQLSTHGSPMQLGRTWTALIVLQVAVAAAILPYTVYVAAESFRQATGEPGYPAEEFLRGWLSMERVEVPPAAEADAYERAFEANFHARAAELVRRLEAEPAVAGVTFANHFPGGGATMRRIEVEGSGATAGDRPSGRTVATKQVSPTLFTVFDVPILTGRGFTDADAREGATAVVANHMFAELVFGGAGAVGRRVRYVDVRERESDDPTPGPWLEIVGVVPNFAVGLDTDPELYEPVALGRAPTVLALAVRVQGGDPAAFIPRLRDVAASVSPRLQLHELWSAAQFDRDSRRDLMLVGLGIVLVTVSVLLLSAAGIYAMMSFTVARRRREIGIRTALGADPRRVLSGIFRRAASQLGAGAVGGLLLAAVADHFGRLIEGDVEGPAVDSVFILPGVALLMVVIGLLATLGPARRGLAVEPTEALKAE